MATQAKYLLMIYLYREDTKTDKIKSKCSGISRVSIVISQNTWLLEDIIGINKKTIMIFLSMWQ